MTIGERLKAIRGEMSQEEFAKDLKVHKNTLANYEAGKRVPDANFLVDVLETYPEIDPAWLLTGEGAKLREETISDLRAVTPPRGSGGGTLPSADAIKKGVAISNDAMGSDKYIKVARYDVAASAGGGSMVANEQVVDYIQFKPEWIKSALGVSAKNLALISVKGDSMEPTLSNGDIIMVDTTDRQFEANAIYVLQNWGSLLVKRIQRKMDGTVVIKSDNKAYEPEIVRGDLIEQLHVVGRVVWYGRRG